MTDETVMEATSDRELFRLALEAAPVAMFLVDERGVITLANEQTARMLGYTVKELVGQSIEDLVPYRFRESHHTLVRQFRHAPAPRPMGATRDLTAMRRDGSEIPVEIGLNPINTPDGTFVLCAMIDLTLRRRAEQQIAEQAQQLAEANARLAELASTDSLTSAWNRRAFLDQLTAQIELAARTARPLSVVFIDVDEFKEYNDTFGHLAGDEVLKRVADILRQRARRSDYVARIGGDEFGVILPETDARGAVRIGERFRVGIANDAWTLRDVTGSIGVTTVEFELDARPDEEQRARLLSGADKALYHSKNNGRNRVSHVNELA